MKKLIIFLVCAITATAFPQQGWFWQNPLPTGNSLNDVHLIDQNTAVAVGELGTIIKTTDGGDSWVTQNSGISKSLNSIYFTDADNGWVVGDYGTILNTTDGGENWIPQVIGTNIYLTGVSFSDKKNGLAVGGREILKTSDGGKSWEISHSDTIGYLNAITFLDSNNAVAVGVYEKWGGYGNGLIIRTTDGGNSWIKLFTDIQVTLMDVSFNGNDIGMAAGYESYDGTGVILKTSDGGSSWTSVWANSVYSGYSQGIFLSETNNAIAVGNNHNNGFGIFLRSTNSGNTWDINPGGNGLRAIHFSDPFNGMAVGGDYGIDCKIYRTTDAGLNWIEKSRNLLEGETLDLRAVSFINKNKGAIVGSEYYLDPPYNRGVILQTNDGGKNFSRQSIDETGWLYDVTFTDSKNGTIIGENGTILRTTDGGSNWNKQNSGTTLYLEGVSFINENIGWVVGQEVILKTTNGGDSWINQLTNNNYWLYAVSFADENFGIAVGSGFWPSGIILKTTNGGNTWNKLTSGLYLNDVFLLDDNHGWVVGYNGIILKTTDGGATWIQQNSGVERELYGVSFTDVNNGTVVGGYGSMRGSEGFILRTTDGGENWFKEFTLDHLLFAVDFTNTNTGTTVGYDGIILRIEDDLTDAKQEEFTFTPTQFSLFQNYPNPFNPKTIIGYQLPVNGNVTLTVYDLLGREVATLVDGNKPAGSYEVEFNASELSSGVYFYRMQAGEFVDTKKFILMK